MLPLGFEGVRGTDELPDQVRARRFEVSEVVAGELFKASSMMVWKV